MIEHPRLHALIEKAARRHAVRLGIPFNTHDHKGHPGWPEITPEEWAEWDRQNDEWQRLRREEIEREQTQK